MTFLRTSFAGNLGSLQCKYSSFSSMSIQYSAFLSIKGFQLSHNFSFQAYGHKQIRVFDNSRDWAGLVLTC